MKRTLAAICMLACAVLGNPSYWVPDADSLVKSDDPEDEWGESELLAVRFHEGSPEEARSFMHFDLPGASPDTHIEYGILKLDLREDLSFEPGEIGIYKVTESWDESTINWNNQPAYDPAKMMFHGWISYDDVIELRLESDVLQEWIYDPSENYGMIFLAYDMFSPISIFINSRETDYLPELWLYPDPFPVESLSWGMIKATEW